MQQTTNSFAKIGDAVPVIKVKSTISIDEALNKIKELKRIHAGVSSADACRTLLKQYNVQSARVLLTDNKASEDNLRQIYRRRTKGTSMNKPRGDKPVIEKAQMLEMAQRMLSERPGLTYTKCAKEIHGKYTVKATRSNMYLRGWNSIRAAIGIYLQGESEIPIQKSTKLIEVSKGLREKVLSVLDLPTFTAEEKLAFLRQIL